ncbi:sulfite exporter TauE/SafE family protein [Radicibacter daui]|uniref:sulfite exporter TauE/SafE family protein n=1 Tax=Radicibacter daui TaxID=3064829 RepID=UPI004046FB58
MTDLLPGLMTDPWFYVTAVIALLIIGISKGGFGGGFGLLGVPLMSLTVSPATAAAVTLPALCIMDLFGLWSYRHSWDRRSMWILAPAAIVGIIIGALSSGYLSEEMVKLLLGLIAVLFTLYRWLKRGEVAEARIPGTPSGLFWGTVAGFTSFLAHAGNVPVTIYLAPQRLNKTLFVGTSTVFFAIVNYVKLVPYALLGQLNVVNLETALVLLPIAPVGVLLGIWLHKRVPERLFYIVVYACIFVAGVKLIYDALIG